MRFRAKEPAASDGARVRAPRRLTLIPREPQRHRGGPSRLGCMLAARSLTGVEQAIRRVGVGIVGVANGVALSVPASMLEPAGQRAGIPAIDMAPSVRRLRLRHETAAAALACRRAAAPRSPGGAALGEGDAVDAEGGLGRAVPHESIHGGANRADLHRPSIAGTPGGGAEAEGGRCPCALRTPASRRSARPPPRSRARRFASKLAWLVLQPGKSPM